MRGLIFAAVATTALVVFQSAVALAQIPIGDCLKPENRLKLECVQALGSPDNSIPPTGSGVHHGADTDRVPDAGEALDKNGAQDATNPALKIPKNFDLKNTKAVQDRLGAHEGNAAAQGGPGSR